MVKPSEPKRWFNRWVGVVPAMVSGSIATFGVIVGYLTLLPRVVISPSQQLDPSNLLSTSFVISNDGYLPMMNVKTTCSPGQIQFANGTGIYQKGNTYTAEFDNRAAAYEEISLGEKATVPCDLYSNLIMTSPLVSADLSIITRFRIGYTPFSSRTVRRFKTETGTDGHLYWSAQPIPGSARDARDLFPR